MSEVDLIPKEYLQAELARRFHVDYMKFMWPRRDPFLIGQHTEAIGEKVDEAIEKYRRGESSYMLIKCCFRQGKSDLMSRFLPSNFIGKFPDQEVIVAAYSYELSRTFSRFCRDNLMLSPKYNLVYPDVHLSKKNRSTDSWGIEGNFGMTHWVGLGGSITGKGGSCFPAGTMVWTDKGNVDIALVRVGTKVLSFNSGKLEVKPVVAIREKKSNYLVHIRAGNTQVTSTNDHRFFVNGKYIPAEKLQYNNYLTDITGSEKRIVGLYKGMDCDDTTVYDIQVADNNNFFANNFLVHNCILIDDFYKGRKEAESEVIRDAVWESVANDIFTRRAPTCIIIILATPWHIDDVFGRIEKKQKEIEDFPQFEEIKFPAFDEKYKGGILFPERFSLSWYQAERAFLGPYASAGLLQCEPVARGGNILEVDKIKKYDVAPEDLIWCRGWDLASTEKQRVSDDPDYTAGVKVGVRWYMNEFGRSVPQIFVDDVIEGRWAAPTRDKRIVDTTISDGERTQVAVEAFAAYKDAYENIKRVLYGIRTVKKSQLPGDKVTKASVLESPISSGNFFIKKAPWNERYIQQLRVFSGKSTAHDDLVDGTVVAYEGLCPHEKRIWPQIQRKHIRPLAINWERAEYTTGGTMHYAGMYQKEDLSVWVVLILWDAYKGFLFIYDAFMIEESIPSKVIPIINERMKLQKNRSEAIVTNDLMWESKGYSKNVAIQYKKYMKKKKIFTDIKQAVKYDEYGTIVEIGQLFDMNMIYIDSTVNLFILQAMSWVMVDRGKHTGSRPDNEDDGFCRALCLVVSELKRKTMWSDVVKPLFADYNKDYIVQNANRRAERFVKTGI